MRTCPQCQASLSEATTSPLCCEHCSFPLAQIAGKYEVVRKLGEGGFGKVYEAHHVRLSRDYRRVVKLIPATLITNEAKRTRLEREVQLTASLSQRNEHIVRVYDDFGEIPGVGFFYVMEHLDGASVRELLSRHPKGLPLSLCARLFLQLCNAINTAHEEQVIHRDLKPENLFVIADPKRGDFLKVLDFGIARSFGPTPSGDNDAGDTKEASHQRTQGGLGTPAYMAPEQCLGAVIDHKADIYAMGLILYELLAGCSPFSLQIDGQKVERSKAEVVEAHISGLPTPLRLAWRQNEPLPLGLANIVMCALEKQPEHRYQNVREFATAFRDVLTAASSPSTGTPEAAEFGRWLDQSPEVSQEMLLAVTPDDTDLAASSDASSWMTFPSEPDTSKSKSRGSRWRWVRGFWFVLVAALCAFGVVYLGQRETKKSVPFLEDRAHCQRPWLKALGGWWPLFPWWHERHRFIIGPQGGLIVSGPFQGKAHFGPLIRHAEGSWDAFIAKLSPCGSVRWVNTITGLKNKSVGALALDAKGHIHLAAGYFKDIRLGSLRLRNQTDIINGLWATLSPQGVFLKAEKIGDAKRADNTTAMVLDPVGNLYASGFFFGKISFGTFDLHSTHQSDLFLAHKSSTGGWKWARVIHTGSGVWSSLARLRWGPQGDLYGVGHINPPIKSQAPGFIKPPISSPQPAVVMLRMEPSQGTFRYIVVGESEGGLSRGFALKVAKDGSSIIAGRFTKSMAFPHCPTLHSASERPVAFLATFSAQGRCLWSKKFGQRHAVLTDLDINSRGEIYVTGFFDGTFPFSIAGKPHQISANGPKVLVMKLTPKGAPLWFRTLKGPPGSRGHRLLLDDKGRWVYVWGMFSKEAHYGTLSVRSQPHLRRSFLWKLPANKTN